MEKENDVINTMTLTQKCALLTGKETFRTRGYDAFQIPAISLSDGPHGLRKQAGASDHLGLNGSLAATCFPTAEGVASSWDPELGEQIGRALGQEAAAQDVAVVLGPGLNMKRSPLCGRNFEYFSEDPYLAGKMAAGYIRGIQENGLAACPKHFAVNNQELRRMASDSVLDERTFREIYLTGFEIAVKEGHPKAIMSSYNMINGTYANENPHLLQTILRSEWGFDGSVITDWGGSNDHALGVQAGSTLEMPVAGGDSIRELEQAVKRGKITEGDVDLRVKELVKLARQTDAALKKLQQNFPSEADPEKHFDIPAHHALARKAAQDSIVLLKNSEDAEGRKILPLQKEALVGVIGDFAEKPRYQGAGSSVVNPTRLDTVLKLFGESGLSKVGFAQGFQRYGGENAKLHQEALDLAGRSEVVLLFLALDEIQESEGLDRSHMKLAENQQKLLHDVVQVNANVVVILSAGSAVEVPWLDQCKALVYTGLGGQAGAGAVLDVLTGKVTPSGKLAESWPVRYEDCPTYHYFPGELRETQYREGLFIGYRYYDTAGVKVSFPFGYGLSYTTFAYSDLQYDESAQEVKLTVTNTGSADGAEIVQLYIGLQSPKVFRARKELKGFAKVFLKAGESRQVAIALDDKAFRYFNVITNQWEIEAGTYELMIGASIEDIRLWTTTQQAGTEAPNPYEDMELADYQNASITNVPDQEFEALLGRKLTDRHHHIIDRNITFSELNHGRSPIFWIVWLVLTALKKISDKSGKPNLNVLFIYNMPLRALAKMTDGAFSMGMVDGILMELKGFWVIGLLKLLVELVKNLVSNSRMNKALSHVDAKER